MVFHGFLMFHESLSAPAIILFQAAVCPPIGWNHRNSLTHKMHPKALVSTLKPTTPVVRRNPILVNFVVTLAWQTLAVWHQRKKKTAWNNDFQWSNKLLTPAIFWLPKHPPVHTNTLGPLTFPRLNAMGRRTSNGIGAPPFFHRKLATSAVPRRMCCPIHDDAIQGWIVFTLDFAKVWWLFLSWVLTRYPWWA